MNQSSLQQSEPIKPSGIATLYAAAAKACRPRRVLTLSEWADAHRMLSSKGSSEPGKWITDRMPHMREIQDCLSARSQVKKVVLAFCAQMAKALDMETPIPTPDGWVRMGDIKPGDRVFSAEGRPTEVLHVSEVFHDKPCFEVMFSDGEAIVASGDHRWYVESFRPLQKGQAARDRIYAGVRTTEELAAAGVKIRNRSRFAVPLAAALDLPPAALPIDPYTLGVWLGDGHSYSSQVTESVGDTDEIRGLIERAGYTTKVVGESQGAHVFQIWQHSPDDGRCLRGHNTAVLGTYRKNRHGAQSCAECGRQHAMHHKYGRAMDPVIRVSFAAALRTLGVLENKHIPAQYLRASAAQRMELLRGLMDTDGTVSKHGLCSISSSSPAMASGIVELITSLGFKPTSAMRHPKGGRPSCLIRFTAYAENPVFHLQRKRDRLKRLGDGQVGRSQRRHIVAINQVESRPCRCIAVADDRHLFLAGRGMVPTHNTEVGLNWIGYAIDHEPAPMLVVVPTLEARKRWVKQRLDPMLKETPALEAVFNGMRSRDASNTEDIKDFPGGILVLGGANSPASLASMPIRFVLCDEVDRFPWEVGDEGDPLGLIDQRQKTFPRRKTLLVSTPTVKGASRIWGEFEDSDQRHRYVQCPHCSEWMTLKWKNLRWDKSPDTRRVTHAYYVCEHSGCIIEEHEKARMLLAGKWIPHNPGHDVRGYHINGLYSPIGLGFTWREMAQEWLDAQGDKSKLKRFINTALGEPWEDRESLSNPQELSQRALPYALRTVPPGVCLITCGVDTQNNRLAVQITGWGKKETAWALDYVEIPGDPSRDEVWSRLQELLTTPLYTASGKALHIEATAIDTGGHHAQDVYAFVRSQAERKKPARRVMAVKGASTPGKPVLNKPSDIDFDWRGKTYKRGVKLWLVGSDTGKHRFFNRIASDAGLPVEERRIHFSQDLDASYYDGLLSEVFDPEKNKFVKVRGKRNEPLDTWNYAYAAGHHPELRIHIKPDREWDALSDMLAATPPEETVRQMPSASVVVQGVREADSDDIFSPISITR